MLLGQATPEATSRYSARFHRLRQNGFFRTYQNLTLSTLGIGTYLGAMDEATDRSYTSTLVQAVRSGINVIDTSLNYRHQRSERAIGRAILELQAHIRQAPFDRDELLICTKAGYLTPQAVPDSLRPEDVAGEMHSMAPQFVADQLRRSRENLGLETIDVLYLHNPETQLQFVSVEVFEERLRNAFQQLERLARQGQIQYYGAATWDGFRRSGLLKLSRMLTLAQEVGGANHRFRFVQLPFNLAMTEGLSNPADELNGRSASVLEVAQCCGVAVLTSASILQSRLASKLPESLAERIPGVQSDAQRAIQFSRSTPGVLASLVGMSRSEHLEDNLGVTAVPPLTPETYARVLDRS